MCPNMVKNILTHRTSDKREDAGETIGDGDRRYKLKLTKRENNETIF